MAQPPDLAQLVAGMTPDELWQFVDESPPARLSALAQLAPRADVRDDPASGDPADMAQTLDSGYRRRPHVDLLAAAIRRTVEEAIAGTGPGRLIVNMPPRVGKSWTTSLWAPAWFLERHPDRSVILASHEANYAVSWGRKVRDLTIRHREQLQVRVSAQVSAAGEWETTLGGGMLSRGIGGSITGRGAHLLLIDDPLKDMVQAQSIATRQAQWDWWLSTAGTRLEPGAAVVVVMTRWHEDDLAGRLTSSEFEGDPDEWEVLRIPALGEGAQDDGRTDQVAVDALDRDPGEPLLLASSDEDEVQATERWRRIRKQVGPYVWNGMYQQRPSEPEGTILKRAWWQFYQRVGDDLIRPDGSRVALSDLHIIQSWDMSFKDTKTADFVCGQVWGILHAERFLLDQWLDRADITATLKAVRKMRARWPRTSATWVEDKANGPAVISMLKRELSGLIPKNPKGGKLVRAWAVQGTVEAGNVWLPSAATATFDVGGLITEAAAFPNAAHDDQVDALTQALIHSADWGGMAVHTPTGRSISGHASSGAGGPRRTITRG